MDSDAEPFLWGHVHAEAVVIIDEHGHKVRGTSVIPSALRGVFWSESQYQGFWQRLGSNVCAGVTDLETRVLLAPLSGDRTRRHEAKHVRAHRSLHARQVCERVRFRESERRPSIER